MLGPIGNQTIIANTPAAKSAQAKGQAGTQAQSSSFGAAMETATTSSTDMFSATAFENTMNNWLVGTIQRQNACRMETYNNAMADWKVNDARCRSLGIASPQQPAAPTLETAEAKPAGWWFQRNA